MHYVLLCEAGVRKTGFFDVLHSLGHKPLLHMDYASASHAPDKFTNILKGADILRVDSPGGGFSTWEHFAQMQNFSTEKYPDQHGRIYPSKPWYDGLIASVKQAADMANAHNVVCTIDPAAVQTYMDKAKTHALCKAKALPVPEALPNIYDYESLRSAMAAARLRRVFLKPRHGSAASGVVAVEIQGVNTKKTARVRVWTSVEMVHEGGETILFNSLKMRTYLDAEAILLINQITSIDVPTNMPANTQVESSVQVESWIPKLKLGGRACDLRLLVIGGKPAHAVVRTSKTPITNLHLGNERHDIEELRRLIPTATWEKIQKTGAQVGALYPDHFCVGLDIAIHKNKEDIYILEINAFGDQIHHALFENQSPYEFQINRLQNWAQAKTQKGKLKRSAV